jgi:hypothetical protein
MKRWLMIGALSLLISYVIAYRLSRGAMHLGFATRRFSSTRESFRTTGRRDCFIRQRTSSGFLFERIRSRLRNSP